MIIECDNRDQWLAERRYGIGGSDAPCVCSPYLVGEAEQPFHSEFTIYQEKAHGITAETSEEMQERFAWGHKIEPLIRAEIRKRLSTLVEYDGPYAMHVHEDYDFLRASLDGLLSPSPTVVEQFEADQLESEFVTGPGVLECKHVHRIHGRKWRESWPMIYQIQCQHQLMVTGWMWGIAAALVDNSRLVIKPFVRDQMFIDWLFSVEWRFWQRVLSDDPPPVDGSQSTTDTLKAVYPDANGETIALPEEFAHIDAALVRAKEQKKLAQGAIDWMENQLKEAIGEATFGLLPGEAYRYSWKIQKQDGYVVKPSTRRVLRRVKGT